MADIADGKIEFDEAIVRNVFGEKYGSADSIIALDARCLVSGLEAVGRSAHLNNAHRHALRLVEFRVEQRQLVRLRSQCLRAVVGSGPRGTPQTVHP